MTAQKREKRMGKREHRPEKRLLWGIVYALIAAVFLYGAYLLVLQYVIIVPTMEPPPTYAPPRVTATSTPTLDAAPTPAASSAPAVSPTPEPTPYVQHRPLRIYFTKPGYWSDVYSVGFKEGSETEIATRDSSSDAAWFELGAAPGESGNCIINGHDSFGGRKGVFAYLKEISYGEEIVVELDNGEFVYYEVGDKQEFLYYEFPAVYLSQQGRDRLTLITCKGDRADGSSQTRVVVVCTEKSASTDGAPLYPVQTEEELLPAPPD